MPAAEKDRLFHQYSVLHNSLEECQTIHCAHVMLCKPAHMKRER